MRIFVTGGTGFVGSHFLRAGVHAGHEIVAQRRPGATCRAAVPDGIRWLDRALEQVDVESLAGIDSVVHLAATGVSPQKATWDEMYRVNVYQTVRLAALAKAAGVKRFVYGGSYAEYGRTAERMASLPPEAPLDPVGGYAASKAAGSQALLEFSRETGLPVTVARLWSVFGEGQHPANFVPALLDAARSGRDFRMTKGEQVRDFVEVTEVARQLLRYAEEITATRSRQVHVASGHPVSLRDFASRLWTAEQAKGALQLGAVEYRSNEVMRFVPAMPEGEC